jgi:MFS family permease
MDGVKNSFVRWGDSRSNPGMAPRTAPDFAIGAAGLLSLAVAMGIGRFAFTPMLPLMIRGGALDVAGGSWLAAANYVGYFAGALLAARLGWPARRLALAALVAIAFCTAAMAVPAGAAAWIALRFLAGVASACAFVGTSVWCLAALAQRGRAGWSSSVYAGVGIGIAITGAWCLAGATQSAPALWLQLGALALVLTAVVAAVLVRVPGSAAAAPPRSGGVPAAGARGLVLAYGAMGFGYILPATFLPVLARAVVDDPRVFGLAWPVFGTTAALSMFAAGWALRHGSRLQVWSISQGLMALGVLLPSLSRSGWAIAASALLVGGTFMVITLAGVQEIRAFAPAHGTTLVARMTAAFALGQIAGPLLSAILAAWWPEREQALPLALQAGAIVLFASAAWLWHRAGSIQPTQELSRVR